MASIAWIEKTSAAVPAQKPAELPGAIAAARVVQSPGGSGKHMRLFPRPFSRGQTSARAWATPAAELRTLGRLPLPSHRPAHTPMFNTPAHVYFTLMLIYTRPIIHHLILAIISSTQPTHLYTPFYISEAAFHPQLALEGHRTWTVHFYKC